MRTQESRIKVAEYERRCAEEDLARLREERAHVPSTPARTGPATDSSPSVIFERMDVVDASALSTPAAGAHDGFLNRIECADLVNVQPVPADPSAPLPDIDAGERRCLNLVTHQYLMRRGYRAAALALRQEATAGQCLDDWSPLGGEPARGEALRLVLRRAKAAETLDPTAFRDLRDERDESLLLIEECESNLKGVETTLSEKMSEIERLNEALAVERKAREEAGLECERWRSRAEEAAATVRHVERAAERMRSENSADPNAELSDTVGHDPSSSLTHSTKGSAALDAAHEEEAHDQRVAPVPPADFAAHADPAQDRAAAAVLAVRDSRASPDRTSRGAGADVRVREAPERDAEARDRGDVRVDRGGDGRVRGRVRS